MYRLSRRPSRYANEYDNRRDVWFKGVYYELVGYFRSWELDSIYGLDLDQIYFILKNEGLFVINDEEYLLQKA